MPISNFAARAFWPEVGQKNTDKGRKLLIRYFNHIFHKKIQIFHFFGRQKKPLIRVKNYWWDNFITFLTIKSDFFIFTAGDRTTDKRKIVDELLITPENWRARSENCLERSERLRRRDRSTNCLERSERLRRRDRSINCLERSERLRRSVIPLTCGSCLI